MSTFSVLTWNIALCRPSISAPRDWDVMTCTNRLLDEIERLDSDFICLQELPSKDFANHLTNTHLPSAMVQTHSGYTTVFLKKGPIGGSLPQPQTKIEFGSVSGITLTLGEDHLQVFSLHLPVEADTRLDMIESLLEQLDLTTPTILAGDLNLREAETEVITTYGLEDIYHSVDSDQYATFDTIRNRFNADIPPVTARYDRIFFTGLVPHSYQLVGTQPQTNTNHYLSDHYGIVVSFGLAPL